MREFQLFRYLKKWMPVIIVFFVMMTAVSYYVLSSRQEYIATAVIRYSNSGAVDGQAPDGSEIDTSEINSAANMTKAMENLGLSKNSYSVDQFCSSITVTPILEKEDVVVQEALNEQGEKSTEKPTVYAVTCTMGRDTPGVDAGLVRDVLNELLDVYFSNYSEKHINRTQISTTIKGIQVGQYDYLDVANQIDSLLNKTIQTMLDYNNRAANFRSAATGYSFYDLLKDFQMLQDVNVYRLYSLILGNRLSKDTDLLVDKYLDQSARYELTNDKAQEELAEIDKVIETYVQKMRSSGNTSNNFHSDSGDVTGRDGFQGFILDEVYNNYRTNMDDSTEWIKIDHTVEYDTLLYNWTDAKNKADYAAVDKDYSRFILTAFGYSAPAASATQTANHKTSASQAGNTYEVISSKATAEEIEKEIATLMERMNELFAIADETNAEYNKYLGAQNIQTLSSVTAGASINLKMYMVIVAIVFLVVGCGIAVLLGRVGDILEYVFLRDRLTGCMNRVACDSFINGKVKETAVQSGFSCINLQLRSQNEINRALGREEADKILQAFGRVLRDVIESRKGSFVGYNGSGQFWAFFELDSSEELLSSEIERLVTVLNDQVGEYPVAYSLGGVNARELGVYHIRALISQAVARRKEYVTASRPTADSQQSTADTPPAADAEATP